MKRSIVFALAIASFASCSTKEVDIQTPVQDDVVFYASFEQPSDIDTKVYANENLHLRWTADDRISIFNKITYNQQYKFLGETGDNAGGFNKVDGAEFVTGNEIPHVVSVYPYQKSTKITEDEILTVSLPSEQYYSNNTFGLGANTMVSVSSDNVLQYKNVGGYLKIRLYGNNAVVNSVSLKGNNGEKLAGDATVSMSMNGAPNVVMEEDAVDEIILICETPVTLGNTAEKSTDFWFVIPPVEFKEGFTIVVSGPFCHFEQSTEKDLVIERNKLSKMSPIKVDLDLSVGNNCIVYTSSDGKIITPHSPEDDPEEIISNEYFDGYGIITFNSTLTSIGRFAFSGCTTLTGIIIPNTVTSIGRYAFAECSSLADITIPDSVTKIGECVFSGCSSLTGISIPKNVTSIEASTFSDCTSLSDIPYMESVTSIGNYAFVGCIGFTDIVIPDCVTNLGDGVFGGCTGLASITIPNNVSSIGSYVFSGCSSLTSVIIPKRASVGDFAFEDCTSLTTIPEGFSSFGGFGMFSGCTSLSDIIIPEGVNVVGNGCFSDCTGLISISFPNSMATIGGSAFSGCSSLQSIVIPERVTSIEEYAFKDCRSLVSVTVLPETPPSGGKGMFFGTNDCPIYVPARSIETYKVLTEWWCDYADRIRVIPSSSDSVPEAVDMGLSVKWASFNVGASKPEEYGDYYAWGETDPYYSSLDPLTWKEGMSEGYSWASYKWCICWDGLYSLTKYCSRSSNGYEGFTDTKIVLDLEDDAAHVNLGGNWRMPTNAEWTELVENCIWTWTKQNGVNGWLVTAGSGNSIFLPAAGYWIGTSLYFVGAGLRYWSSSLLTIDPLSAWLVFYDGDLFIDNSYRYRGFSVRPVYAE
ncbi:MAG: leucine-rich repeat protein [Bacteroidales bacterium]|nr:leucine-rich repeat protein [Bacteroidales bacterium]